MRAINVRPLLGRSQPHEERHLTLEDATVSVVIPTLNEAGNLPYVLNTIPLWVDEVILVDGRSSDDSERIAKTLWPDVRVVRETRRGKGAALRAGLTAAKGDLLVAIDADGSMDGAMIPRFRDALLEGADYVKGSRFAAGAGSADITPLRRFGDAGICFLIRSLFGARYTDATYGFFAVRADRLAWLNIDSDGFEVETLIGIRARRGRLRIAEVPCYETHRIHGASGLHVLRDGLRIFRTIVVERLRPYRIADV
ncbi:MAG: glycosyltransferase family 2 protein [Acidimicrobiales bacterium]